MPAKKKPRAAPRDEADVTEEFEKLLQAAQEGQRYVLRLFVSGSSPRSTQAISAIRELCEERLPGRYELEVVDIYQQPAAASGNRIVAAPTLVKELPEPVRRVVGNLADREKILIALNLREDPEGTKSKWTKV